MDLKDKIGYIYKINSPNGKVYIGQTYDFKKRKYYYKSGNFKKQIKLYNSVLCHGWSPIDNIEIIEECLCGENKEILNEREKYWILHYDSFINGLNCNAGGNGNIGHNHSDETKKKISEALKGKKHTEERNKKKSQYTKGRKHTDLSKKKMSEVKKERMSDEIKDKIRLGLIGNKNGIGNIGGSRKILCLNNNIIYNSIKKACIELDLHDSNVGLVCSGIYKQTKGYKFIYYEEKNINI